MIKHQFTTSRYVSYCSSRCIRVRNFLQKSFSEISNFIFQITNISFKEIRLFSNRFYLFYFLTCIIIYRYITHNTDFCVIGMRIRTCDLSTSYIGNASSLNSILLAFLYWGGFTLFRFYGNRFLFLNHWCFFHNRCLFNDRCWFHIFHRCHFCHSGLLGFWTFFSLFCHCGNRSHWQHNTHCNSRS